SSRRPDATGNEVEGCFTPGDGSGVTFCTVQKAMKRITVESPLAGDVKVNEEFARAVCHYITKRGDSPYASHLFFTQFLDDLNPEERTQGIEAGFAWGMWGNEVWFCLEKGRHADLSNSMKLGHQRYSGQVACVKVWFEWNEGHTEVHPISFTPVL
ncbi:MAG TPA: hypothetical protein VIY48_13665, partial [Candidatus Paceibacterota bacterium]